MARRLLRDVGGEVVMIERHYGKWMGGDDSVQLAKIGEGRETASPPPLWAWGRRPHFEGQTGV